MGRRLRGVARRVRTLAAGRHKSRYSALGTQEKKEFWKQHPLLGVVPIEVPGLPCLRMHCDNDDSVVKDLFWTDFRGWERTSLMLWNGLLGELDACIVLDVGAYTGIYSLYAALCPAVKKVVAFDIQQRCLTRLSLNGSLNNLDNIEGVLAACVGEPGRVKFHYYEEEGIISSVAGVVPKKMNNLTAESDGIVLDAYLQQNLSQASVGLVKIDVEGAEQATLRGLAETIRRDSPDLLVEINKCEEVGAVQCLFPAGYSCYSINERRPELRRIQQHVQPFADARNYLFSMRPEKELSSLLSSTTKLERLP